MLGLIRSTAVGFAYVAGVIIAAVGMISSMSIIGRAAINRPLVGDFELVAIGIFVAGSLMLPYCQLVRGHLAVDFFTIKASAQTVRRLERFGDFMIAVTLFVVSWRTGVGSYGMWRSGETSMLLGFPIWFAYLCAIPGVTVAAIVALTQAAGWNAGMAPNDE